MKSYRPIEHTADIGIEVQGSSPAGLFIDTAKAMVDLIVECRRSNDQIIRKISLKASIREELLVKWLEELLYLFEIKHLVPIDFRVDKITDKKIDAEVACARFDPKIHKPRYQIKAVTYHNLIITEEKGLFKTRIIFDI